MKLHLWLVLAVLGICHGFLTSRPMIARSRMGPSTPLASDASSRRQARFRPTHGASPCLWNKEDSMLLCRGKKSDDTEGNSRVEGRSTYSRVDDGSPLGVGVVFVGSLLALNAPDTLDFQNQNTLIWLVFVTASTVAGAARLIRYYTTRQPIDDDSG